MRSWILGVGLGVILCALPAGTARAGTDCSTLPPAANSQSSIHRIADEINEQGLSDFSKMDLHGFRTIALSPLLRWYTRFLVAVGSDRPPSAQAQAQASIFTRAFSGVAGRDFASRIWLNDVGVSYREGALASELRSLCASTVVLHWKMGANDEAPVNSLMREWILQHRALEAGNALDQFIRDMNPARLSRDKSNHPFNAVTAMHQRDALNVPFPTGMLHAMSIPWYKSGNGITGIRLDGSALSLYIFYGGAEAIERLQGSMNVRRWNELVKEFRPEPVSVLPYPLLLSESFFFDPGVKESFGTSLLNPHYAAGIERVGLQLDRTAVTVSAASGIEGHVHFIFPALHIDRWYQRMAQVSPGQLSAYVLVDRKTGAIITISASIEETAP